MKTKIFTIYDSKAEAYLNPFFMASKGLAIRAFTDLANDPQHSFFKYAPDYTLFEIGEYDDQSGTLLNYEAKLPLGTALEFKSFSQGPNLATRPMEISQ